MTFAEQYHVTMVASNGYFLFDSLHPFFVNRTKMFRNVLAMMATDGTHARKITLGGGAKLGNLFGREGDGRHTRTRDSSRSISSKRLYFSTRSERESDPVLMYSLPAATARSAIKVSSVSPERCEMDVANRAW